MCKKNIYKMCRGVQGCSQYHATKFGVICDGGRSPEIYTKRDGAT